MFKRFRIWFIALAAIVLLLSLNGIVKSHLNKEIKENKLIDEASITGVPPVVAFTTVALGGFRGLLADILWLRAGALQEQGRYFELVQLASWMTKLQPKFTGAASYLAWNMAYNISVTFRSPEDRWRWVQRGIELIRDEALNYNANDPKLYQQLGWIYQHKIGNVLDDAQRYYKFQIAKEMQRAFGGVANPDWSALAKAPKNWYLFWKANPDPAFRETIRSSFKDLDELEKLFRSTGQLPAELKTKLKPEQYAVLENFMRASWLREKYKIRPEIIIDINNKYGSIDWRMSEALALYWAWLGILYSPKHQSIDCDRMITQSLKEMFVAGRMLFPGPEPTYDYVLIPNLDLADAVRQAYLDAAAQNDYAESFKSALNNFMIDAIVTLYSYGRYKKAKEFFLIEKKDRPWDKRFMNFEQFVVSQWTEDIKDGSYKQAHDLISGLIFTSCLFLAYDDRPAAEAHLKLAKMAYTRFTLSNKDVDRVKLPSFAVMKNEITTAFIKNYPKLAPRVRGEIIQEKMK